MLDTTDFSGDYFIDRRIKVERKAKEDFIQSLVQGLPSVGPVLAKRLLSEFKSIKGNINMSNEDLLKIEGIGKAKAQKIIHFIQD